MHVVHFSGLFILIALILLMLRVQQRLGVLTIMAMTRRIVYGKYIVAVNHRSLYAIFLGVYEYTN